MDDQQGSVAPPIKDQTPGLSFDISLLEIILSVGADVFIDCEASVVTLSIFNLHNSNPLFNWRCVCVRACTRMLQQVFNKMFFQMSPLWRTKKNCSKVNLHLFNSFLMQGPFVYILSNEIHGSCTTRMRAQTKSTCHYGTQRKLTAKCVERLMNTIASTYML